LRPDYADARNDYGAALSQAGRDSEALVEHAAAVRLKPDDPTIGLNLACTLLRLERPAEARLQLERLLAQDEQSPPVLAALGQALLQEQKYDAAIERLTVALRLRPAEPLIAFHLALAWQGRAGDAVALPLLLNAAALAPERVEARLACAAALQRTGQREAAVEHFAAAARLRPDSPEIS
jgi:Flp pilus assembly protein TadD